MNSSIFQDPSLWKTLIGVIVSGIFSVIGGMATYFYEIDNKKLKFSWKSMFFRSVVAFVIGAIAGEFIPEGENYYGLVMVVGVNAYPFFALIRKHLSGPKIF